MGGFVSGIEIQTDAAFLPMVDETDVTRAAEAALELEGRAGAELTIVLTDDETVAGLNEQYRGLDGPTDVLSFSAVESAPGFVMAPEALPYLGDIVIAIPYSRRQASELGRSLRDELRLLVVHGVLHLLGYDHATPEEEAQMWARQDEILAGLAQTE